MEEQFLLFGLSDDEAIRIRNAGGGNASPPAMTKSTEQIVRDNLCTLFNLFNLLIALALARIGAWSNLLFILVVALNAVIGIVQELHAKRLIEQISVLTAPRAQVIRSGNRRQVPVAELVLGDILFLDSGVQVPADATLLSGEVEIDESLLTGEAEPVRKSVGSALLSGSVVLSGTCRARVERTGSDSYAARLTQEARAAAPTHSELLSSMRKVTQFTAFFIPPLGIILFLQAVMFRNDPLFDAVTATAAALLGMLPKGLVLLISVSLATGVARLARHNVLVQNLFSLENLAHVDVLCLDKTGTLTEGKMCLERVVPLSSDSSDSLEKWMGAFLAHSDDNNATFQAMRAYFSDSGSQLEPTMKIPFSSQRKWSAMEFKGWGTLVVGAPERMTGTQLPPDMTEAVQRGRRVLMVACTEEAVSPDSNTLPRMRPLAAMVFSDPVRSGAAKTLDYFRREGVAVKVISGDHPAAAAAVAEQAGLARADARLWVDMSRVAGVFFVKTIYSVLLALLCMLTNFPFPLIPIQVTLLDLFLEGYPAFFQSFVPDNRKVTGCFLPSVLRRAIPNALAILLATAALLLSGDRLGLNGGQISGAVYLMIGVVEAEALLKSCMPLNRLRLFLFTTACVGFFTAALLYHTQLKLPLLPLNALPAILLILAAAIGVERLTALLWSSLAHYSDIKSRKSENPSNTSSSRT